MRASPLQQCNTIIILLDMLFANEMYRFFTSFRMTRLSLVVILSGAKDLYESRIDNSRF